MVVVECSVPGCEFKTSDVSEPLAIALLGNHSLAHQSSMAQSTPAALRGPKLERPKINVGVSIEDWNVFLRRWEVFRTGSNIDEASSPSQLFQCAGAELGDSLLMTNPSIASEPLEQLLTAMRSLAVIPVATCVLRSELFQLRQERDEAIRAFAARVRGKAETCAFAAQCECGKSVNYTDNAIRDVLLNGLADTDIRREILGTKDILTKPINDIVALIEGKEMARNALPSSTLSAVATFHTAPVTFHTAPVTAPPQADRNKEAICPDCKTTFKIFTEGVRGWNTQPHQVCINCYHSRRRRKHKKTLFPGSLAQHTGPGSRSHLPGRGISDKCSRFPPQAPTASPKRRSYYTQYDQQAFTTLPEPPHLLQGGMEASSPSRAPQSSYYHLA